MEYRLNKQHLLNIMEEWNRYLKRKVHLIACGGTAMTLVGVKPSTKDIDFMIPNIKEHAYLTHQLEDLGYVAITGAGWQRAGEEFRFDLFKGNSIHTTGLMASPLEPGRNILFKQYSHLYIGILNEYDLISSKLMRGTSVDYEDCLMLAQARITSIDVQKLIEHFREMVSYDVSEDRIHDNIEIFVSMLRERGIYE